MKDGGKTVKLVEIDNELVANYDCQLLRESPNGKHLHFYYPGGTADGGKDGILLKIVPFHGDEWIGTFARDPTFPKVVDKSYFLDGTKQNLCGFVRDRICSQRQFT